MKKFRNLKSKVVTGIMMASPFLLMAEGEANPVHTEVVSMMNEAKTSLSNLLSSGLPIIGYILGAGIIIWAGFKLFRLIQKAFGFGAR